MSAPALVQYADGHVTGSIAFPSNVAEGNMLVVIGGSTSSNTSDTLGNKYFVFQQGSINGVFNHIILICPASKASGANTVNSSAELSYWAIAEISGCVLEAQSGVTVGGISPSIAGAINELLVGLCTAPLGTITGVGGSFTQASGSFESKVSLEYETLSGAGSVSSDFTISGSNIGTSAFTLLTPPTPLVGTPSVVQSASIAGVFPNSVTKNNSILVVASQSILTGGTLSVSDTQGNSYVRIVSNITSFGSFLNGVFVYFCAAAKSTGANTVSVSGGQGASAQAFALELTPCVVTANSAVATGTITGADIVSAAISAAQGQLLVAFANGSDTTGGFLGLPCSGFAFPPHVASAADVTAHSPFAQIAVQPVVASGNFNSDFSVWNTSGSFSGNYQTGIITLGFGTAATPTFSPSGGTYVTVQSVTLSCSTPGSTIYYTTDGSTPTTGSTQYTGAISVSTSQTVKAIAAALGYNNSSVGSAVYIINLPVLVAPTFTPVSGFYPGSVAVTIATVTLGASIYFTLDGSTPTPASTFYTSPILLSVVGTTTFVQAIVVYPDVPNSPVGGAEYIITPPLNLTKLPFSKRTTAATAFFRSVQLASSNGAQWYVTTSPVQRGQLSNLWLEMRKTYEALTHQDRRYQTVKLDALIVTALAQATSVNSIVQMITPGIASGQAAMLQTMQQTAAQAVTQITNAKNAPDDGE